MTRKQELMQKIIQGEGTLEQDEQWLAELRQLDPYFDSSDRMLGLETIVEARRVLRDLEQDLGGEERRLTRDEMIKLVELIMSAEGSEAEIQARLMLLRKQTPCPYVSDLIYYPEVEMSAEEVVDAALAYRPIQL